VSETDIPSLRGLEAYERTDDKGRARLPKSNM